MRVVLLLFLPIFAVSHQWKTVYDRIMEEGEFSGFRNMTRGNRLVTLDLLYGGVTVFVPENKAIERYDGFFTQDLIRYHVGTEPYTLKELALGNTSIESAHGDNPPLWVSVVQDEYYINNAKIVKVRSNYVSKCKRNQGLKQVLHMVDRVLDPMFQRPLANPSAYDFLENHLNWKLGSRTVSNFFERVLFHQKQSLYTKPGGHTFFVPIDDRTHDHRLENIDSYIIEGHVVPNMVLFTRPATKNFTYETVANGDYIYIIVALNERNENHYVKSYTILGNSEHKKGDVVAEIVKGDIPVTNGVVHLISQPLAVFDRELRPFPYLPVSYKVSADPELNLTYHVGEYGRVNKILGRERGMYTFFAPRNRAWDNYLGYNHDKMGDILAKHLVVSDFRYTFAKLASTKTTILETLGGTIRVNVTFTNGTWYIIWGQKWVRVHRPDYECTDGVVHIVDDIFAAPKPPVIHTPDTSFWSKLKNWVM